MSSSTGSTANGASTRPCTRAWKANVSFGQGENATVSVRMVAAGYGAPRRGRSLAVRGLVDEPGDVAPARLDPRGRQLLAAADPRQRVALVGAEHEEHHVPGGVQRRERQRQPLRAVRGRGGHAPALLLVAGV